MMRRVSSRQRLSSLDLFDANASEGSEEEYQTCYDENMSSSSSVGYTIQSSSHHNNSSYPMTFLRMAKPSPPPLVIFAAPLRRKRGRKKTRKWVVQEEAQEAKSPSPLDMVMDDVKLYMCSFLDVKDGCALMGTSKHHWSLIRPSRTLWSDWGHYFWPHMPRESCFVDKSCQILNLPFLFALDASTRPTAFCECTLHENHGADDDSNASSQHRRDRAAAAGQELFRTRAHQGRKILQFVGVTGRGDRSVQADAALPKPSNLKRRNKLMTFLRREHPDPRPFVEPFVHQNKIHLTPRLVSYYEVTILPPLPTAPGVGAPMTPPAAAIDCVAVGLATKDYSCPGRMPGWDTLSFGYHGDDGGIFHASGEMKRRFGPRFGKGDTVGCGVDHRNGGIFFCLNGKFLGYGWTNLSFVSRHELYPTLGIDSNNPIDANFGTREFAFDLPAFLQQRVTGGGGL